MLKLRTYFQCAKSDHFALHAYQMFSYFTEKSVGRGNSWDYQTETLHYLEHNPCSRVHVCTLNVKGLMYT